MPGGRPRTPTRVLQLRGTHRKDRHGQIEDEPTFDLLTELPPAPGFFDAIADMEWNRVGPELIEKQLLTTVDLAAFTGYCLNVSRVVAAERKITELGLLVLSPFGQFVQNPAVPIARQCGAEVRKFAQEFGMTPSARTKVRTPGKPKPKVADPWDKVGGDG